MLSSAHLSQIIIIQCQYNVCLFIKYLKVLKIRMGGSVVQEEV